MGGTPEFNARTRPHMFTAAYLEALPTLSVSQADDLKIESYGRFVLHGFTYDGVRVWLARTTTDDGEPGDAMVTVEVLVRGRWRERHRYDGSKR